MYADGSCWIIRCKYVINQGGELRLGPLGLQEQYDQSDAINNTARAIQSKRCN